VPADVVFELHVKQHALFTREGDDLHYTCELSLQDALCDGFQRSIKTLDGKALPLNMTKMPDSRRSAIRGAGLPNQKRYALALALPRSLTHALTHSLHSRSLTTPSTSHSPPPHVTCTAPAFAGTS